MNSFKLLLFVIFVFLASCSNEDRTVNIAADDPEMLSAFAKANATLPKFWESFENPKNGESDFSLKVKIEDQNGVEYFWVININKKSGKVVGEINNDPEIIKSIKIGEIVEVPLENIVDWQYIQKEKIVGNFTLRPLLKYMSESEAKEYKDMLAEP